MEFSDSNPVLEAVSRTFNEGINDRTAVTAAVIGILAVFLLTSFIVSRRARKRTAEAAEASFQQLIRKFNLTIRELDLIEELSASLHKKEDKYHLLLRAGTFRQAVRKTGFSPEELNGIGELERKLGFAAGEKSETPHTSDLAASVPVKIIFDDGENGDAEVYSIAESGITFKYHDRQRPVTPEEDITAAVPQDGRIRLFRLRVDRVKGELFSAPHAEEAAVDKLDRKLGITAELHSDGGKIRTAKKAFILRLNPDGAVISLPPPMPEPETSAVIYLDNDRRKAFRTDAIITKISEEKQLAAVRYSEPPEDDDNE